ncbi:hypothetical protein [Nostoc sp.]
MHEAIDDGTNHNYSPYDKDEIISGAKDVAIEFHSLQRMKNAGIRYS